MDLLRSILFLVLSTWTSHLINGISENVSTEVSLSTHNSTSAPLVKESNENNGSINNLKEKSLLLNNENTRNIFLKQINRGGRRNFFGFILIPCKLNKIFIISLMPFFNRNFHCPTDIICFFAAKGFWPFYPPILQYQVNEMGRKVFSLSDDRIQQFCRGKFNFQEMCYRPGK